MWHVWFHRIPAGWVILHRPTIGLLRVEDAVVLPGFHVAVFPRTEIGDVGAQRFHQLAGNARLLCRLATPPGIDRPDVRRYSPLDFPAFPVAWYPVITIS